jgi:hypothetical protein
MIVLQKYQEFFNPNKDKTNKTKKSYPIFAGYDFFLSLPKF